MTIPSPATCFGLLLFLSSGAAALAEPPSSLRSKIGDSRAWYLAVKDLPGDDLAHLLGEDWVVTDPKRQSLW